MCRLCTMLACRMCISHRFFIHTIMNNFSVPSNTHCTSVHTNNSRFCKEIDGFELLRVNHGFDLTIITKRRITFRRPSCNSQNKRGSSIGIGRTGKINITILIKYWTQCRFNNELVWKMTKHFRLSRQDIHLHK